LNKTTRFFLRVPLLKNKPQIGKSTATQELSILHYRTKKCATTGQCMSEWLAPVEQQQVIISNQVEKISEMDHPMLGIP